GENNNQDNNSSENNDGTNSEEGESSSKMFVYKALVEDVTGTWCPNCPEVTYAIQRAKAATTSLKDRFVVVAIHYGGRRYEPMEIDGYASILNHLTTLPPKNGDDKFPFYWAAPWYKLNRNEELYQSRLGQIVFEHLEKTPSSPIGIKISSELTQTGGTISVGFKTTENELNNLKYHVFVTENNITHHQSGAGNNFRHDDVLRAFYGDGAGNTLETLTRSKEINKTNLKVTYSLMSKEKLSNVKVVVFVTDANTKAVLNVQEATANETKDYQYVQ
ncbi:MAG: Omp28-related outer membrane protein, partial [Capnocytophaga felis]|nr:Omp28-related outer membrane protein [Capnocytophaga felis]